MDFIKPRRLIKNSRVAIISASWGGPHTFPHIYELGIRNLEQLGVRVKEFPTARADPDFLYNNPQRRADDVNNAFLDPDVEAIISSIGGEDSIRILPYLDEDIIRSHPKILMGYSDTTTLITYCNQLGLVTLDGPSIMAGFAQMRNLPPSFASHVRQMLFHPSDTYEYHPYDFYSDGYPDWANKKDEGKLNPPKKNTGWNWVQGESIVEGRLFGGNIEVLEWLRGTKYWPNLDFLQDKILFLQTSEEKPHRSYVRRWLRTFGIMGGFKRITGLLFGRARDYSDEEKKKLDENIRAIVSEEFDRPNLPIITNMDFGHTDPQFIIPLGVKAEIDCQNRRFRLIETVLR